MAETINGLYQTEVIRHRGPWRTIEEVEFATWRGWIGSIIEDCWRQLVISHRQNLKGRIIANGKSQLMQLDSTLKVSGKTGAIHCELHPLGS